MCLLAGNDAGAQPAVAPLASAPCWKDTAAQADGVESARGLRAYGLKPAHDERS